MKSKRVFLQPISKQIFEAVLDETSDSQEPLSAVGNGEQSPCTPTEAGNRFSFNENIFATPKLCPPTPTKTPGTTTLKPSSTKAFSAIKSPLFDSESEESDNDENKFVIKSPISIKSRPNRFQVPGSVTKPRSPLAPVSNNNNLPPHRDFSQIKLGKQKPKRPSFSLLQQSTSDDDNEELTPPGVCKKRPFDAIRSPISTKSSSGKPSSLLGGTPNFDFPDLPESDKKVRPPPNKKTANTFMDLSNDFNSPGMCPPSTIKPKYSTLMSDSLSSSNWFASPSITKNLMETPPQIEMTPPSPVLFQSSSKSKGSFFSSLTRSTLDSPGNPFDNEIFQADFDESVVDCSDDMVSDDDNASMEDFNDLQSQMQASTPPRATLSQTSPNSLNIQLIPARLTTNEDVHENPFSPERNFKKTKTEEDYFSITDDKNTSSYLQGKIASSKKSAKKKRQSDLLNLSDVNLLNDDPIFEVYFSRYLEDFEETGVLGDGCFGRVTKAKNRFDGITYAIKSMKRKIKGKKDLDKILKEVQALATLVDNPYLVRYYSCWIEGKLPQFSLFLQTELCEGGSLARRLGKQQFTELSLIDLTRQLASGLMQMHAQNIVHLDLKPDNIYLTSADDDKPRYKIGDLGLASSSLETLKDVMEGDSRYLAKELLSTEENSNTDLTKADIFSLGATIYECAIGRPLPNNGAEWHDIRNGNLKDFPTHFSESFKSLLLAMLHIHPANRPTAYQLLQHPLFIQQKLTENDLVQTIQHQQSIIIKLKEQEAILRRKIEELERK